MTAIHPRDFGLGTAAASPIRRVAAEAGLVGVIVLMLVGATFLQRFGYQSGSSRIAFNMALTMGCVAWLALSGKARIEPVRLIIFCWCMAVMTVCALVSFRTLSHTSLILLMVLYAPFVFTVRMDEATYRRILMGYQNIMLVIAILGIIQFFAQMALPGRYLFTWDWFLPQDILLTANLVNPLYYGALLNKSNGFVLLEASAFSQYLAIAIIIELLFFKPRPRLLIYASGIFVSYSGTGMILLGLFLPLLLIRQRRFGVAFGLAVALALVIAFGEYLYLDAIQRRLNEFNSTQSSGFARFVSPTWLIGDFVLPQAGTFLFGLGPGAISDFSSLVPYEIHDPSWGKLMFEYGLLGSLAFSVFFLDALFRDSPSPWLSGALLIGWLVFGGTLLDPRIQVFLLVLVVMPRVAPTDPQGRPGNAG